VEPVAHDLTEEALADAFAEQANCELFASQEGASADSEVPSRLRRTGPI
jgi:hypothetical protein